MVREINNEKRGETVNDFELMKPIFVSDGLVGK